ncbi:MAG: DUF192 domain-containing protein [Candidatus Diapherotrites archaeon]
MPRNPWHNRLSKPLLLRRGNGFFLTRVRHATSSIERMKGLIGVKPSHHTYGLVFHLNNPSILSASIHMLFMQMPIDVVWLDSKQKVVDWKGNIRPWTLHHSPFSPAAFIIELPSHTLTRIPLTVGKKIEW